MLRLTLMAIAASAAFGAIPIAAATQVDTAKGQVLLELQATGRVTQPADSVEMTCTFGNRGATKDISLKALAEKRLKLAATLKAAGLDTVGLRFEEPTSDRDSYYTDDEDESDTSGAVAGAMKEASGGDAPPKVRFNQVATLKLSKFSQREMTENAMAESRCGNPALSKFAINDFAEAGRKAKDNALVEARKQADAYAKSLNLKVLRVARVSEYSPISALIGADASELALTLGVMATGERQNQFGRYLSNGANEDEFLTMKTIWVDFVLAPN